QGTDRNPCAIDRYRAGIDALHSLFGDHDRRVGPALDLAQKDAHASGRGPRLLGQAADLRCDDAETLSMLAGPGGLDGRVQCQHVRLLGDRVDRHDDVADLLALLAEGEDVLSDRLDLGSDGGHAFDARGHAELALVALLDRFTREPGDLLGPLRVLLDGGAYLVDGRGRLVARHDAR